MPRHSSNNPAQHQRRLDYEQDQRERRQLVWAVSFERTGLNSRRMWGNIQALLIFLINCDRGNGTIPYIQTIATQLNWSRRTADRTIAAAKQLGVLKAETRSDRRGRISNSWTIDFEALASLGVSSGVNPRQSGVDRRQNGVNPRQSGVDPILRNYRYPISYGTSSSSSKASTSAVTATEEEEEVRILKSKFREYFPDVLYIDVAIDQALAAGCSTEQLYARGRFFGEHRYEWPEVHRWGALVTGIKMSRPDTPHDRGWPSKR